jgi:hypothetical protein
VPRRSTQRGVRSPGSTSPRERSASGLEERRGEGDRNFGLIHLAACLGAGGAAVLAVNLIELLT